MISIGLVDYDLLRLRYYKTPNYDLGVIYAHYRNDKNVSVRLVSSPSYNNLSQYDKIYVFKQSTKLPHPSGFISNYYKLPIEEYGPGFIEKPLRPFQRETQFTAPDFTCYNNMLMFSLERPKHPIAWRIDKHAIKSKYKPLRLYEVFEGEELKKDFPVQKYNAIYDNPVELLNNKEKWEYYNQLLSQGYRFKFAQTLDISQLNDTNILEQVLNSSQYASIRQVLIATEINDVVSWLVNEMMSKKYNRSMFISVELSQSLSANNYFKTLLLMNYYNFKTQYRLRLMPMRNFHFLTTEFDLAQFAFDYLTEKPYYMSYYEYVFNIAFLRTGMPKELIHTGEDRYEYILKNYGMPPLLVKLEDWIRTNPECEEWVFIGGDSNYEEQRRKYYDKRGSYFAFGGCASRASDERSS